MQYSQDTTLTKTINLPVTIDNNYDVITFSTVSGDGINFSMQVDGLYPTVTDGLNTYTWVEASSVAGGVSGARYMIKVPFDTSILFDGSSITYNGVSYVAQDITTEINSTYYNNYKPMGCYYTSTWIENTALLGSFGIYPYRSATTPVYNDNFYKIEIYRNNVLVDSTTAMHYSYYCNISFYVNDTMEMRVYRNENTTDNPIWSTRYVSYQKTITTAYDHIPIIGNGDNLYLEEVDAYIDDVPYLNKHPYSYTFSTTPIDPVVVPTSGETIPLEVSGVYNYDGTDITQYVTGYIAYFHHLNTGDDFDLAYDSGTGEFTYADEETMPEGVYSLQVYAITSDGVSQRGTALGDYHVVSSLPSE